jgi:hypothetical protein
MNKGAGQITYIPAQGEDSKWGVLFFFATLAYPRRDEREKRNRFARAMGAPPFKRYVAEGCDRSLLPAEYRIKNEKIQGAVNMGVRRLSWRAAAGGMAYGICVDGVYFPYDMPSSRGSTGVILEAPNTVNKAALGVANVRAGGTGARYIWADSAVANVKQRIWASSLPVLHLAFALYRQIFRVGNGPDAITKLILDPQWLRAALITAEGIRVRLPSRVPTFDPDNAIRLLPAEALP